MIQDRVKRPTNLTPTTPQLHLYVFMTFVHEDHEDNDNWWPWWIPTSTDNKGCTGTEESATMGLIPQIPKAPPTRLPWRSGWMPSPGVDWLGEVQHILTEFHQVSLHVCFCKYSVCQSFSKRGQSCSANAQQTTFRNTERSVLPDEFFPAISLYNVWVSCLYPFLVSFSHIVRILTRTIFFY